MQLCKLDISTYAEKRCTDGKNLKRTKNGHRVGAAKIIMKRKMKSKIMSPAVCVLVRVKKNAFYTK